MMAAVLFSSTKPNAFDGPTMAEAKLLQIANGNGMPHNVSGTVIYDPVTNDAYDTEAITLEKILQGAAYVVASEPPPIVGDQQYLQAQDGTWHMIDLVEENGINATRVGQAEVPSPGDEFLPYAVLTADDATNHKLLVVLEDDVYTLQVDQEETAEDGVSSVVLTAPSGLYPITIVLEGEIYAVHIAQPA